MFATHYHKLADAHAGDPATSIRHMACHVDSDATGREQVHHSHSFEILKSMRACRCSTAELVTDKGAVEWLKHGGEWGWVV